MEIGRSIVKCGVAGESRPRGTFSCPPAIRAFLDEFVRLTGTEVAVEDASLEEMRRDRLVPYLEIYDMLRDALIVHCLKTPAGSHVVLSHPLDANIVPLLLLRSILLQQFRCATVDILCHTFIVPLLSGCQLGFVVDCAPDDVVRIVPVAEGAIAANTAVRLFNMSIPTDVLELDVEAARAVAVVEGIEDSLSSMDADARAIFRDRIVLCGGHVPAAFRFGGASRQPGAPRDAFDFPFKAFAAVSLYLSSVKYRKISAALSS